MRTRTLLLLAVGCGLAILAAGLAKLLFIAADDGTTGDLRAVGDVVAVGDVDVTVADYDEADGVAVVTLRLGGVDDPDGAASFRLVVPGEALRPLNGDDDGRACDAVTERVQTCTVSFDVDGAAGGARVLVYERGDDRERWALG